MIDSKDNPPKDDVLRLKGVDGIETVPGSSGTRARLCTLEFPIQKESDIAGGGQPMERDFLINQITQYHDRNIKLFNDLDNSIEGLKTIIDKIQNESEDKREIESTLESIEKVMGRAKEAIGSKEIAIHLGKETLMFILSQKNCEGIRFYFCNSPYGNTSVAAVGVRELMDEGGRPQQIPHPQDPNRMITVGQDIGLRDGYPSIYGAPASSMESMVLNGEVGPPYRIRQLLGLNLVGEDPEDDFSASLREFYNNR